MKKLFAGIALAMPLVAFAQATPNPILFVTQVPVPDDFATIGAVFANHRADEDLAARGGDLWIRYVDGTLRNLTEAAGLGNAGFQGANAITVRDPAVHWSGTKAVFSMAIGAPTARFQVRTFYFQLYEITNFGAGQTPVIAKVPNQPANFNNVQPTYASDGSIIFVSDRPRSGERHLYPQLDEYESTPTPTGLWKLGADGSLVLLQHSPSGSFTPIVDSYGRVIFSRWDHLQRDQQNEGANNPYGTFNYTSEAANALATSDRTEVFPEPRIAVQGVSLSGLTINQFFPWQINQDGTDEETLNHVGRHELHRFFARSFTNDANLVDFARDGENRILNMLQIREDPTQPGRYVGIDAPEFATHAAGQLVRLVATPTTNPADMTVEFLTPRSTANTGAAPDHSGHYRNPVVLADGTIVVAHTAYAGANGNTGTRANPDTDYKFRLKRMTTGTGGFLTAAATLTSGITKSISYWDPDVLVSYDGPLWELSPVEVVARPAPTPSTTPLKAPELAAFAAEGVDPAQFVAWLKQQALAVMVMRDVTTRDRGDRQQPFNLRVPGGVSTVGGGGKTYDIAHFQFFQGDQLRGIGGQTDPRDGRRVLAQTMHAPEAMSVNPANPGGPAGSAKIFPDGSVAFYVPTRRALTWQATAPDGAPVVRERYWITAQPGEVRACDGCHGVNRTNQANVGPAANTPEAFRELLRQFKVVGPLFGNGFE